MEKIKKTKKKISSVKEEHVNSDKEDNINILSADQYPKNCWGWDNINDAACDVFNSIHRNLLEGQFVFGYKNTSGPDNSQLMQVVVVRFSKEVFGVGVVTSGYTMLLPQVPLTYLDVELAEDLKKWKIESYILNTYKSIINSIKNEITCD